MTHEEAARILDPETSRETLDEIEYYGGFRGDEAVLEAVNDACRIAADVLRNKPTGDPLTLEQLRKMRGKWVWLVISGEDGVTGWAFVSGHEISTFFGYDSDKHVVKATFSFEENGKEFFAYAYPPAHIDREAWVSVKERLPDDNERVIAYRPNEADVSAYKYCVMWGWSVKMSMKHRGISHWMPLPEPPAELEKRMGVMV